MTQQRSDQHERFERGLRALAAKHSVIREIRGAGVMWGIDLHRDAAAIVPLGLQHRQRQPVLGQEHVRPHHREVGLVPLQREGAVAHVAVAHHLETDVLPGPVEGAGVGLDQRGLGPVLRAHRHREGVRA